MQYTLLGASLIGATAAFPHMAKQMMEQVEKRAGGVSYTGTPTTVFDPTTQFVSNSGAHKYVAPDFKKGDLRGPCPGLNAMANHGYIAHNGVTNLQEAIEGTNTVFGMGRDLGGFLSAYATLIDGDPITQTWSIGGPPAGQILLPGQSQGLGLTGSHNKYETDSSPMRGDLYQYGDNFRLQLSQFQEFYDYHKGEANPNYSFDDLVKFRSARFTQSVQNNPYFFYGPFTGIEVSQAAFTFISAFMSNHSTEYPNGFLSRSVLKSFMAITETGKGDGNGKLSWNPGTEKIPDNWYKRAISNPYSIPAFEADILRIAASDPRILSVGGNTGKTNTFTGVDISNLSGGVYNLQTLASGNNAFCFGYQFAQQVNADALKGLTGALTNAVSSIIAQYISPTLAGCPQLQTVDRKLLEMFPGYTRTS